MNLYEINAEMLALLNQFDPETGEVPDEVFEQLASLKIDETTKIENTILYIKNQQANFEALKAEKQSFENRQRIAKRNIDRASTFITDYLLSTNRKKFETTKAKAQISTRKICEVFDEAQLPEAFRIPQPFKFNKDVIKKAISEGKEVTGARLVDNVSLSIK